MKKVLKYVFLLGVMFSSVVAGQGGSDEAAATNVRGGGGSTGGGGGGGALATLKNKYEGLPPKGRFVAGAAVGFIGTRMVLGSATSALKVAGVAFIA